MRAVIQRVIEAQVEVDGKVVGAIGPGLLVFLGLTEGNGEKETSWMIQKILSLRIFRDENEKMNLSVQDKKGGVLVVSQFTLYGDCSKGRRPSFIKALSGQQAEGLYNDFVNQMKEAHHPVACGEFGADMKVSLINDGPVTLIVDSPC